jgi:hypothetical protein
VIRAARYGVWLPLAKSEYLLPVVCQFVAMPDAFWLLNDCDIDFVAKVTPDDLTDCLLNTFADDNYNGGRCLTHDRPYVRIRALTQDCPISRSVGQSFSLTHECRDTGVDQPDARLTHLVQEIELIFKSQAELGSPDFKSGR